MTRLHRFIIAITVLLFLAFGMWTIHRLWVLFSFGTEVVVIEPTGPVPTDTLVTPSAPSMADLLGPFDVVQARDGKKMKKFVAFAQTPLQISWDRGATPLGATGTAALLGTVDATIEQNLVEFSDLHTVPAGTLFCEPQATSTLCQTHIFTVGHMFFPQNLQGKPVYLLAIPNLETADVYYDNQLALYDADQRAFIGIGESTPHPGRLFSGYIATDVLTPLIPPLRLQNPVTREIYLYETYRKGQGTTWYDPETARNNQSGILSVPQETIVNYSDYTSNTIAFIDPVAGPVYLSHNQYEVLGPDGSVAEYDLKPYFLQATTVEDEWKQAKSTGFTPLIRWSDARVAKEERYVFGGIAAPGLCVSDVVPGTNIVDGQTWFKKNMLVEIGKTYDGDPVYTLRDKATNPYYKTIFDFGFASSYVYGASDTPNAAAAAQYDELSPAQKFSLFLADEPLFFWRDPRGHWRVYMKATYRSESTCIQ